MTRLLSLLIFVGATSMLATSVHSEAHESANTEEIFLPENAILDTAILFAIGAREAQQELRGSYGWDTFQEGLVEGVYFRFDPDGYARFSPNARLDTDLFEVICRARTLNCQARKGPMSIMINGQGLLQLSLEGAAAGDQFFIAEGVTEIELPDRILQPLDSRFENVLAVGGELIVRRGQNETMRVSLTGFSPVTSYLRWILAEQDYLVLPRNWPVPNSPTASAGAGLTTPQVWRTTPPAPALQQLAAPTNETASVSQTDELASLRALVEQIANDQSNVQPTESSESETLDLTLSREPNNEAADEVSMASATELDQILTRIAALESEIAQLRADKTVQDGRELAQSVSEPTDMLETDMATTDAVLETLAGPADDLITVAEQIEQLSTEFAIDPSIAALLLRLQSDNPESTFTLTEAQLEVLSNSLDQTPPQLGLLDAAQTLQTTTTSSTQEIAESEPAIEDTGRIEDYVLLTDYFKSVSQR